MTKPLPDAEYNLRWRLRVWSRCVETNSGCWVWQGFKWDFRNQKPGQPGYGGTNYRGQNVRIHRKMLELELGRPLGPKMHACHTCDNPPCCNPAHLYEATNQQNHIDGGKRKRMQGQTKTHCKYGHEFTDENTYWAPRKAVNGVVGKVRSCKECNRIRLRRPENLAKGRMQLRRTRALQSSTAEHGK
jgi:HNH endonuclease